MQGVRRDVEEARAVMDGQLEAMAEDVPAAANAAKRLTGGLPVIRHL